MTKKNVSIAVALAALTFIVLFLGSKFYEVYALQNPLSQELAKYNINKMHYNQQEKTVVLYTEANSNLPKAVADVNKKFGNVKIELQGNSNTALSQFYKNNELYVTQFIDAKQYGNLADYLKEQCQQKGYKVDISIDDNNVYLKLSDNKSSLYKIFPRWQEGEV